MKFRSGGFSGSFLFQFINALFKVAMPAVKANHFTRELVKVAIE
jgi:hypothetical protein